MPNIVEIAVNDGRFTTLVAALPAGTVESLLAQIQPPHVRTVWQLDAPRWKELLYRSLRSE